MTYNEFFKKAVKSLSLYDKEREVFINELEEDIKSIENTKEQSVALKVLEDIKNNMSAFKRDLQKVAEQGNLYARRCLSILEFATEGKEDAPDQDYYISDQDYMLHYNYKKMFVGLDDIKVINKYHLEDCYTSICLALMGNVPDDEIAPVGNKYQIGYDALEKYKFQISETITRKIKELADAAWQIGNPVNEEKLEDLICYINIPYENTEIQSINSKNVKRVFKEFIEAFSLDTDEWIYTDIDIYSDKFKNLCKIHIYLPIEGEVTGVYFFERYYGQTSVKDNSINVIEQIMPNKNETQEAAVPILSIEYESSETDKETMTCLDVVNNPDKMKRFKAKDKTIYEEITNQNGYIMDKRQKRYDSYKENFPKIYNFDLNCYIEEKIEEEIKKKVKKEMNEKIKKKIKNEIKKKVKEEVIKLGNLLNYIEYDLLAKGKNSSNTDKLSKKLNIFLMLKSPAIEIFEKFPSKNIAERDCFIFLKSEFLRHIELSDIIVSRGYIFKNYILLSHAIKSAAYTIIDDAVIYNTLDGDVVDKGEIRDDYKTHLDRLNALNFEANTKTENDNVFFVFLKNIVIDEIRLELKMRDKNVKSLVEMDSEYIATEIPNFKDMVLQTILDETSSPLPETSQLYQLCQAHYGIFIKCYLEKLQSGFLSYISYAIIIQLCKFADTIKITLSKSYNNTRIKTMSLEELLKSNIKGKEVKRILSYLIERQFYYNLGYGKEYEIMNDFRIALESRVCDLTRTNFDAAHYHRIISVCPTIYIFKRHCSQK